MKKLTVLADYKEINGKITGNKWYAAYTLFFILTALIVFMPYNMYHKSFIWGSDGLYQTYSSMVYIGRYYASIVKNVLHGNFNVPMIDFNIGLGYDIITTLNYYGLGDPILLLSAFVSKEHMEVFYGLTYIVRLYIAGICFKTFCDKREIKGLAVAFGAIAYTFCGFGIYAGERHPYFINAMIYLPLMLCGVELVLKKKKGVFLSLIVFLALITNYYFFYMITIMALIYAIIRFFEIYQKEWARNCIGILLSGIFYYALGVMLASFLFIPVAYAFMNNARGTSSFYRWSYVYGWDFYEKMLYVFGGYPRDIGNNYTLLAYTPVTIFSLVTLYFGTAFRKRMTSLKIFFAIGTLMVCSPYLGYLMNGGSYISNRCVFGYSFIVAMILTVTWEQMSNMRWRHITVIAVVWGAMLLYLCVRKSMRFDYTWYGVFIIAVTLAVIIIAKYCRNNLIKYILLGTTVMLTLGFGGFRLNSKAGAEYYLGATIDAGKANSTIAGCSESALDIIDDEEWYRVGSFTTKQENQALSLKYNGTGTYFSLINSGVYDYFYGMEISDMPQAFRNHGFEGRTALETLASVKYFTYKTGTADEGKLPFGFEKIGTQERNSSDAIDGVAINQYALPIGYTYDKIISRNYLDSLTGLQKQQALMQAVALEDTNGADNSDVVLEDKKIDCTVEKCKHTEWDKNTGILKVHKKDGSITVSFDAQKDHETYLNIKGVDINGSIVPKFKPEVECNGKINRLFWSNDSFRWHLDRKNFLINLGSKLDGKTEATLRLTKKGTFKIEDIEIYSIPMESYAKQAENLRKEALQNVTVSTNKIVGTADVSSDKVMVFSIPYSIGWKAYVDGEEVNLQKANIMFMAINLPKGHHDVELKYCTPYLKTGVIVSCIGLLVLLITIKAPINKFGHITTNEKSNDN